MLGNKISTLRRKVGLTQADLASRINVSASTIGMYEQGRREPSLDVLIALADVFDISIDELLNHHTSNLWSTDEVPRNIHPLIAKLISNGESRAISREDLAILCVAVLSNN